MVTYTNSGGLSKPATGEFSGTWGDITNTNFDLIDRLVNGTTSIALTTSPYSLATSDGALSDGQFLIITFTGTPAGAITVNITPQDATKIYLIKNTCGQTVTMSQGSGATVSIATGTSKIIYTDGLGSVAAVFDFTSFLSMSSVSITGGTITGITDLAVADGGTGASTAAAALANLGGQATITGAATTVTTANLTVSRAVTSNASGKIDVSAVTTTELGYVSGVTSAIQTQIGLKAALASPALTGQVSFDDGSAAAPSITNAGDTNTGLFFPAADTIGFAEGGAEAMRINSSGQIETTAGTAALPAITTTGDTNTGIFFPAADTVAVSTAGTEAARVDSGGNFLYNTSGTDSANGTGVTLQKYASGAYITIAHTTGAGSGEGFASFFRATSTIGSITQNGTTGVLFNTTSDYRVKDITGPVTGAKDFIMALQPKQGTWKIDGSPFVGFLAHEFQEVSPSSVAGIRDAVDADGTPIMQAMQASSPEVMANLVALIQEQQQMIQELTARIVALEAK